MNRGISILPGNCQAYRDGYRFGAYEERGGEEHIVEFFKEPDEIQLFVNEHPEYGCADPEARKTLAGVLRGDREKVIGHSLYRIACNPETRMWFVQEFNDAGNGWAIARGLHNQNLGDTVKEFNKIDRERYLLDRDMPAEISEANGSKRKEGENDD